MPDEYQIHLNFLPVAGEIPNCNVFRLPRGDQEKSSDPSARGFSLPPQVGDDEYERYWVRLSEAEGYESVAIDPSTNRHLTSWLLYTALKDQLSTRLETDQFHEDYDRFRQEVALVMRQHKEGQELLVLRPYFLYEQRQFGLLVDFHFRKAEDVPFSFRIQQLSLSLNSAGKRNVDYYLDRTQKILGFVRERFDVLSPLRIPGADQPVSFSNDFCPLPATRLRSKVYIFGSGRDGRSQFNGLRDHGPLKPLDHPPHLLFAFQEPDRHVARTLAQALIGPKQRDRFGFPGFQALFKSKFTIDSDPIVLQGFTESEFQKTLVRVSDDRQKNPGVLPVFVLPEGDENGYMDLKAVFAHAGIPTQVCTLPVIQDDYALKWAIGNIALQIFCKAGGQPWKVRPTSDQALIVGISQSHKMRETENGKEIEKYFAFSVMTDNSGLFQKISVLGESEDEDDYLTQLRNTLAEILKEESTRFSRVVVHTSFKLKYREIDAIQETVEQAGRTQSPQNQFAVVKVNHRSRFFGINRAVNCLVPFEATKVRLGAGQYLVWFEGIFPDKPTATKLFPGPTHLEFLRFKEAATISDNDLLQDLVNLSGANWRGFNAKSAPVSVFYCHLVADLVHEFQFRGLPMPKVTDLRPWFL